MDGGKSRHGAGVRLTAQHALSTTGWLAGEEPGFRDRLLSIARWRRYENGQALYITGDAPSALFGLEAGLLDVSIPISDDEDVVIHRAQPGFWIGDSAVFSEQPHGVSVSARDDCLLLTVPAAPLRRMVLEHPHDLTSFYRLNHANTMETVRVLAETIALPPRARFARMLLRLASRDGVIEATQAELGALAGMSRVAFRRAFADLIAQGVVLPEYGTVRILDQKALHREVTST